ncbi:MAG: hypothetical protein K7J46_08065 [Bryobacter sp.]|nr:hypothetical protein [Bryobacter sp. CoA8 C33]
MPNLSSLFPAVIQVGVCATLAGVAQYFGSKPNEANGWLAAALTVSGILANLASEPLARLFPSSTAADWAPTNNHDLERVVKHTLLALLYQTAQQAGKTDNEIKELLKKAETTFDWRGFSPEPDTAQLLEFLRQPLLTTVSLDATQADEIANTLLAQAAPALARPYSQALQTNFFRAFEVLLREDERAFRGMTIYLHRLLAADFENLQQRLSQVHTDLQAGLTALLQPQPTLERFEHLRKPAAETVRSTDFQFKRRASAYRPAAGLEQRLLAWLNSPQLFAVLKLTGPAGSGKSRLALELSDYCHHQGWLTGFVAKISSWPAPWQPISHTLAVVDYAASKSIGGQSVFAWLEQLYHHSAASSFRVRIVLIDRSEQGPLWSDWHNSEIETDLNQLTLSIPLTPFDRPEFDAMVEQEWLRRNPGQAFSLTLAGQREALASRQRGQFRPLFALLTAAALTEAQHQIAWSPELLVESALKSQVQQWGQSGITDEDLDLLFEATLTQGESNDHASFSRARNNLPPARFAALQTLSDPGQPLGAIVPDLLGEFFVLMRLRGKATTGTRQAPLTAQRSREILERCWRDAHAPTASFAGLLLEDYLAWTPTERENPAEQILQLAFQSIQNGVVSMGLVHCCFAAAWKKPNVQGWSAWLLTIPDASRLLFEVASVMGRYNATVVEPDPQRVSP